MSHVDRKYVTMDTKSEDVPHKYDISHQVNIADDTTVNLTTAGILDSPMQATVQSLSPVIQVDGPLDMRRPIPYQPEPTVMDGEATNVLKSMIDIVDDAPHGEVQRDMLRMDITPITHEIASERTRYTCSNCSVHMTEGKRCTFCSNIFICNDCFDTGFHKQCRMFAAPFNATNMPREPHCLGCFKLLEDIKDRSFFKCTACPRYFQCSTCKINCVHCYHTNHLTEVSLDDIT